MFVHSITFWRLLSAEGQVLDPSHPRSVSLPTKGPYPMAGQRRTIKPKSLSLKANNFEGLSPRRSSLWDCLMSLLSLHCSSILPSVQPFFLHLLLVIILRAHSITFLVCKFPPQSLFLAQFNLRQLVWQFNFGYERGSGWNNPALSPNDTFMRIRSCPYSYVGNLLS